MHRVGALEMFKGNVYSLSITPKQKDQETITLRLT